MHLPEKIMNINNWLNLHFGTTSANLGCESTHYEITYLKNAALGGDGTRIHQARSQIKAIPCKMGKHRQHPAALLWQYLRFVETSHGARCTRSLPTREKCFHQIIRAPCVAAISNQCSNKNINTFKLRHTSQGCKSSSQILGIIYLPTNFNWMTQPSWAYFV